jgi:ATP-dependent metalloprotease
MPEILVERFETGRYASNTACESLYSRATQQLGSGGGGGTGVVSGGIAADTARAVGRAVAAHSRGGNIASVRQGASSGSGAGNSPIHVVVEESRGNFWWKVIRFSLLFGLSTYLVLITITLVLEGIGMFRKVGGSKDTEVKPEQQKTRFSDVKGCDEAIEELQEIVDFLKSPDKYNQLGGKLPKGVLMIGPPGTGKTLLARAVAGEAGVPFFYMSGSEFDEVYVGVGAKRVRELFQNAKSKAPAIVFIDELDAVGGKRNERDASYHMQTLNQMLTELDGFDQSSGVVFIAATNFPQMLDKALTRPGRFDRQVVVPLPDVRGRVAILDQKTKEMQIGTDVDTEVIARGTPGFSGADLENLVNQAAVHASKKGARKVDMASMDWARDRIMMGAERKSAVIKEKDKVMTAYHEAGHALVAMFTSGADPLYKCTIMPRGQALGVTSYMPEIDKVSMSKQEYKAWIDIAMGGKVAEEIVYGDDQVSSGCSSDLSKATNIAYSMVTEFGMSDKLGSIAFTDSMYKTLSTETKQKIEDEVRKFLDDGLDRARTLLKLKRNELDLLAKALIKYETLNKEEMEKIVRGEKLPDKLTTLPGAKVKLPEFPMPHKD